MNSMNEARILEPGMVFLGPLVEDPNIRLLTRFQMATVAGDKVTQMALTYHDRKTAMKARRDLVKVENAVIVSSPKIWKSISTLLDTLSRKHPAEPSPTS